MESFSFELDSGKFIALSCAISQGVSSAGLGWDRSEQSSPSRNPSTYLHTTHPLTASADIWYPCLPYMVTASLIPLGVQVSPVGLAS